MAGPTILVTTPTGHVGAHVVRLLLAAGLRPRVLVRDPDRLDPAVRDLVDVRVGDQLDRADVLHATAGVDAVHWVSPEVFTAPDPLADLRSMADNLVAAVAAHRVPRVVFQSSGGAEVREGAGLIDGLGYAESLLDDLAARDDAFTVVHLRNGYFFTNLLGSLDALRDGVLPTTQDPALAIPWVDPRDIAEVSAVRLIAPLAPGRHVQAVHGPADLDFADVAAILSEVLDRPIEVLVQTDAEQRDALVGAGLSEAAADGIVGMTAGLRGIAPEQSRDVTTTTPSTLEAWATTVLRPALAAD